MSAAMAMGGTDGAMFTALLGCQRGTWAHSPLYQWMTNNYEAMSKAITGKKVRWQKMSEAAESAGLMNVNGEPPKPATVRSTWYRVRKAVSAMHSAQEDARNKASAARAVARAASQAHKSDDADGRETLNRRMAEADADLREKQLQDARDRSRSVLYPETTSDVRSDAAPSEEREAAPAVKIGRVAEFIVMRKQAPRYGRDQDIPLPPPYVGPRPAGMPKDLPLEALMPLDASGRTPEGKLDFEQMPGLPRRSFFDRDREWALACLPMIEVIPPRERSKPLKAMFCLLKMKIGR
ncbi:hypothetical protein QMA67_14330 [Gluconobacter japonicus]|uniref:hypothetical protein n=1 Tax=Gluconobacter TaxID=441 RepID=UPI001921AC38|nr:MULTISPECIES: hypothetical protein [Gluconobacter]MBS1092404.1 hypothetical protein [Gluconobacter sp. Dm-74]MDI6654099.1 hypothetical protein [Gluconobacter japonicus]QQX92611.1 hypothetical protein IGS75_13660 [Gluconobacter sphaericus]